MVDFYTNYTEGNIDNGFMIQYFGDNNLKLSTSDVFEIGYRGQLSKQFQIDLEGFCSSITNFPSFEPNIEHAPILSEPYLYVIYQYQNLNMEAKQLGATASLFYSPSKKLQIKAFGTIQETKLKGFDKRTTPMLIAFDENTVPEDWVSENPTYKRVNQTHKNTPMLFGGLTVNYRPYNKWNIFTSLNYYSKQTYEHDYANSQYHYVNTLMNPDYSGSGTAQIPSSLSVNHLGASPEASFT